MSHTIILNETQLMGLKDDVIGILSENERRDVLYTAQVVDDQNALMRKYPSELPNKFYHHSTNKFGRQPFDEREGEKLRLHIIGRLRTDKVDALVVENPNSSNDIPHITLATADGIKPVVSNYELHDHYDLVEPLDDFVDTTFSNISPKPRLG